MTIAEAFLSIGRQFHFLLWRKIIYSGCSVKHPERSCLRTSFSAEETDFVIPDQSFSHAVAYGFRGNFAARSHRADMRWQFWHNSQNKWPITWEDVMFVASSAPYLRQLVRILTSFRSVAPGSWNNRISYSQVRNISRDLATKFTQSKLYRLFHLVYYGATCLPNSNPEH